MIEVESEWDRREGVTYVTARVRNTRRTPQRVTLRSTLDGPVWPPRYGFAAAPQWTDDTWEDTVAPKRTRGVGFASPADPPASSGQEPLELVSADRVPSEAGPEPREVVASLESWSPPSDTFVEEP